MTPFDKLKAEFCTNWTTILVGWDGPGRFPPQVTVAELDAYATERLVSGCEKAEEGLIVKLLSLDLRTEASETIRRYLTSLSDWSGRDRTRELRKWQVILLEEALNTIPNDPIDGLTALTDFWNEFDFPPDGPHVVQGRGNTITPVEYYQEENFRGLLSRHRAWIREEKAALLEHRMT